MNWYCVSRASSVKLCAGALVSMDDFYITDSRLVVLSTTNPIFSSSLDQFVTPESLLAWQRVRIANAMAHGGREWSDLLSRYNTGLSH